jgi:hypothetical protein
VAGIDEVAVMTKRDVCATGARLLLGTMLLLLPATPARGQGWAADVYAGRALYEPVSANVAATSLVGAVRYGAPGRTRFYVAAAAPLDDSAPAWGALGGTNRWPRRLGGPGLTTGLDVGAHGYVYRDAISGLTGSGGTLEAGSFLEAALARLRIEVRVGGRQHLATYDGEQSGRGALETALRVETQGPVRFGAGTRLVHVSEGSFPAVGADVAAVAGPAVLSASAERWLGASLQDLGWSAGATVPLGFADVWAAWRHDTRDPLYWNSARRTWSIGLTRRFGARTPNAALVAAPVRDGRAVIRLAPAATAGSVSVAGDFTGWQPQPMQRVGSSWELELPLPSGVYRYAFVDAQGRWFVPSGTPGRREDGMGGHVVVLVVP